MTFRLTKKRQEILSVLKDAPGSLSAAAIHSALPHIDLTTIYRNLEHFVAEKIIRRVHIATGEAQFEYQHEPHHHAICNRCSRVIHFTAPDTKITSLLGLEDFVVEELEVIVRGTCTKANHRKK